MINVGIGVVGKDGIAFVSGRGKRCQNSAGMRGRILSSARSRGDEFGVEEATVLGGSDVGLSAGGA